MQTRLNQDRAADARLAVAADAIRSCVHCGYCLATCPTYLLLGDELDSPRGRIYQVKEMLEAGGAPSPETVRHVDRCLSCLACVSTCPSSVDYMHLIDEARAYIEQHHRRAWHDRLLRSLLAFVLPRPGLFRVLLRLAPLARPFAGLLPMRLRAMLAMAPTRLPPAGRAITPPGHARGSPGRARVALLEGCAQQAIAPEINAATIRLLTRLGVDVEVASKAGCCGALPHHLGKVAASQDLARTSIDAWLALERDGKLDAIVINASGCGTMVKDYAAVLADDAGFAGKAARVAELAKDISEILLDLGGPPAPVRDTGIRVAYQSACSLQHGQGVTDAPVRLLQAAGFEVVQPREAHLCCGSAGTYNLLQPEIANRLRARKAAALEATGAAVVATGNIGCLAHLRQGMALPVVHTVELLDWAAGGPEPPALEGLLPAHD